MPSYEVNADVQVFTGELDLLDIPKVANIEGLISIDQEMWTANVGAAQSQGDAAMMTDDLKTVFRLDGEGQNVGVISDSFDVANSPLTTFADDIASGDLPADVNILQEAPAGIDEGRGMAQLIADVAPDADLAFHAVGSSQVAFADAIDNLAALVSPGSTNNTVVDDIIFFAEPMFQDGVVAQAADRAFDNGVPYFSAAGNGDVQSYESAYRPIADGAATGNLGAAITGLTGIPIAEFHDFDSGNDIDIQQGIFIPDGSDILFSFQWATPAQSATSNGVGAASDMDIFLIDPVTNTIFGSAFANLNGDPVELFQFTNNTGSDRVFVLLLTKRAEGDDPAFVKYVDFGGDVDISTPVNLEHATASGSGFGHSVAEGAIGVGAAPFFSTPDFGSDPAVLEPFSSPHTTPILFDTAGNAINEDRDGVDIVAPDGTDTTFFGQPGLNDGTPNFPNFFGTSAAAPHAAAATALIKQAIPDATPEEIYAALRDSALAMDNPFTTDDDGDINIVDDATGFGLINPEGALRSLADNKDGVSIVDGTEGRNRLNGDGDDNIILAFGGNDLVSGMDGDDRLIGEDGSDRLLGGNDNDILFGGEGNDLLIGGSGNDILIGDAGRNTLRGQSGEDSFVLNVADAADRISDFETGTDTLVIAREIGTGTLDLQSISGGTNVLFNGSTIAQISGVTNFNVADLVIEDTNSVTFNVA